MFSLEGHSWVSFADTHVWALRVIMFSLSGHAHGFALRTLMGSLYAHSCLGFKDIYGSALRTLTVVL